MKPKLIVLLVLMIAAFALGVVAAYLAWDIVCPISFLLVDVFAIFYVLDDPEMLGYYSYSVLYNLYFHDYEESKEDS